MALIHQRRIVDDRWRLAPDDRAVPNSGAVIVSLARWQREAEMLRNRRAGIGVRLAAGDPVQALAADLQTLDLIAIEFDAFTEGRGYSQARLLRERLGYGGELRAVGDVSRDRVAFMERSGFDSFELRAGEDPHATLEHFNEISVHFQPAADRRPCAARRRGWRGHGPHDNRSPP